MKYLTSLGVILAFLTLAPVAANACATHANRLPVEILKNHVCYHFSYCNKRHNHVRYYRVHFHPRTRYINTRHRSHTRHNHRAPRR
jgi:hypothetical protein